MSCRKYADTLRQRQRDLHERTMGVTSEDLQEAHEYLARFGNQATLGVLERLRESMVYGEVIAMIEQSEDAQSLVTIDPDKTPTVLHVAHEDGTEDDTDPERPLPRPGGTRH